MNIERKLYLCINPTDTLTRGKKYYGKIDIVISGLYNMPNYQVLKVENNLGHIVSVRVNRFQKV